jgi:hypothetical protein
MDASARGAVVKCWHGDGAAILLDPIRAMSQLERGEFSGHSPTLRHSPICRYLRRQVRLFSTVVCGAC